MRRSTKINRAKKITRSAFTLVEIIAVLVILSLLAAVAIKNVTGKIDKAKVMQTKVNLAALHEAVMQFKLDTGRYPTEEEGLMALLEEPTDVMNWEPGGYLQSTGLPIDGWNHEFIFQLYPDSGKPFVIISYGADDEPEGEDYDTDLYSTDAN